MLSWELRKGNRPSNKNTFNHGIIKDNNATKEVMGLLSNSEKEELVVHEISSFALRRNSYLKTSISVRDKDVSFDGHIDVFSNNSERKDSFLGKVLVQVKSTGVNIFSNKTISFSFNLKDIQNYLKTSGVLIILGEVRENETDEIPSVKLFYKSLLPLEIDYILNSFGEQGTKVISLRPLDETTLYEVCTRFIEDQKKQPSDIITNKAFDLSEFQNYRLTSLVPIDNGNLFDEFFQLYGIKNETHIPISLAKLEMASFSGKTNFQVGVLNYELEAILTVTNSLWTLTLEDAFEIGEDLKHSFFFL